MGDAAAHRDRLVDQLATMGAIQSAAVERAFRAVPRHRLVETFYVWPPGRPRRPGVSDPAGPPLRRVDHDPGEPACQHLGVIYSDQALMTRLEDGWPTSSSSQPSLMARMLELLDVAPGMKVLEIGAGTGYNAALLAELVGDPGGVVTVDSDPGVVAQTRRLLNATGYRDVALLCRDGFEGAFEHGPFDRIVASVGCPDLSPRWGEQLASEGFMLIPLEHAGAHPLVRVESRDGQLCGRVVGHSGFISARGALARQGRSAPGLHVPAGAAIHERALWEGYGGGEPLAGGDFTSEQLDFGLFVALRDRRAICGGAQVALSGGPRGWVNGHRPDDPLERRSAAVRRPGPALPVLGRPGKTYERGLPPGVRPPRLPRSDCKRQAGLDHLAALPPPAHLIATEGAAADGR